MNKKKVIVYVDGYNFYYGLRNGGSRWKRTYWLDIVYIWLSWWHPPNKYVFILLDFWLTIIWLAVAGLFLYYTGGISLSSIISSMWNITSSICDDNSQNDGEVWVMTVSTAHRLSISSSFFLSNTGSSLDQYVSRILPSAARIFKAWQFVTVYTVFFYQLLS